ncbi:hypothetical protein Tco_0534292 [Tanacetum coccineum]
MAEENVSAPAPTRSVEQILPFKAWLPIGKGNLLLNLQNMQKNPIFRITDAKSGVYRFQLDEQWFTLNAELLRKALDITLANRNNPTKKTTPHVIPYCRFAKLIIYDLGCEHNLHRRPESAIHVTGDDFPLGNLKFVPKGEKDEVFGMPIPKELITEAIQKKDSKGEEVDYDLQRGIQMSLESFQPPINGVDFHEHSLGITQKLPIVKGKGKGIATDEQDDTSTNIVSDTPSPIDAKTGADTEKTYSEAATEILDVSEEQGEDVSNTVALEEKTAKMDEGQAGSNPVLSHVALAGPDPEPMHEDFIATVFPQVHESLKHTTEEHVHLENPLSSTDTLTSMKSLEAFNFGDQFINDKSLEDKPGKANVQTKVESRVTVLIHQASLSVPPLSTPIIYLLPPLSHPEHVSLYEALEASMDHENRDVFLAEKAKSRKRRRDNQDPHPPPPKDSDQSKKKRHDSDASGSKLPPA